MKVQVKLLKGGKIDFEAEPSMTIAQFKEKLAQDKGDEYGPSAKVIYTGKILKDADTFESIGFKESDFLVVMAGKAKASKPKAEEKPAAASSSQPSAGQSASSSSQPAPSSVSATGSAAPATSTGSSDASFPEATVNRLCDMGYPREEVVNALRAAFGNPDRAVEYLTSGYIPNDSEGQGDTAMDSTPDESSAQQSDSAGQGPSGSSGLSPGSPLAELSSNPNFIQLRTLVQRQPELFPSLMQHLAQQNPELVQLINDNQEDFYHLINDTSNAAPAGFQPQPGRVNLNLSPEEEAAVQRLVEMGFDYATAVQAYIACDKNENMAANYLFEHGME